jgi:hypothetical protein
LSSRQWATRELTENEKVRNCLFSNRTIKSVFEFYSDDYMPIKDLGKVINLANYTIELGYYLTEVLGYEISDVTMTLAQTNVLLNTNPSML